MRRVISFEKEAYAFQHAKMQGNISSRALKVIKSRNLTYHQKLRTLAKIAEDSIPYLDIPIETLRFIEEGIIHDLDEGHAPYRPRYILPDYTRLMEVGSRFLELDPPSNMYDAIGALVSMYTNVPSITSYPVYLGEIDKLLLPYAKTVSSAELVNLLIMFWKVIDRMLPDAFVHANLSFKDNIISHEILRIERKYKQVVPNLTLKFNLNETPKSLVLEAIQNALYLSKPYLVNDLLVRRDWPQGYGVASCYNILPYKGGSFTLIRVNLFKLAVKYSGDIDEILNNGIPSIVKAAVDLVEERVSFIVEDAGFFDTSFLSVEEFIDENNFTAMFGIYALAEAMEYIVKANNLDGDYGYSEEINKLALNIVEKLYDEVNKYTIKYLKASKGKMVLHSQAGISTDTETPGIRVKYGKEPHPYDYINILYRMHKYIKAGSSEIFTFNQTTRYNPEAIYDLVAGAFKKGMKLFSITSTFSKFIRVTGYLIKKEDLEKFKKLGVARHDTAYLGAEAVINQRVDMRKTLEL